MEQFDSPPEKPELRIETGVAATKDFLIISCSKKEDRFEGFSRVCVFNAGAQVPWHYFDLPLTILASAAYHPAAATAASLVLVGEDGDVFRLPLDGRPAMERVAGSGLWNDDSEGWGYLTGARQIGEHLYVYGAGGQIYRRADDGTWQHMDDGLLQKPDGVHNVFINAVDGAGARDIHAAGWDSKADAGLLFFREDDAWKKVQLETAELNGLCVEDRETVWVCGKDGTLLRGNRRTGFIDVSGTEDVRDYSDVKVYAGKVYLAAPEGLFVRENDAIEPVVTGLVPEYRDGHVLQVVDGVLWSIGYADIARYDGRAWERIAFPGNPPIV